MSIPPQEQSPLEVAREYLGALASNDLERILTFFAPDAEIVSPTYGRMSAEPFYRKLCSDTRAVTIGHRFIEQGVGDRRVVTAHFDYHWELGDGTVRDLEILDVFTIEEGRIKSLRIFADGRK